MTDKPNSTKPMSDLMLKALTEIEQDGGLVRVRQGRLGHRFVYTPGRVKKIGGHTFDALVRRGHLRQVTPTYYQLVKGAPK